MSVSVSLIGAINNPKRKPNNLTETQWIRRRPNNLKRNEKTSKKFPVLVSTDPTDANPQHLKHLFAACNHSYHRFPNTDSYARIRDQPFDVDKLRVALAHSAVVVSVFCNCEDLPGPEIQDKEKGHRTLVGFGRAVSDYGLTASLHDVMVNPSLQGMGIGMMIVKKIIRILTNNDIYDISTLCSEKERFFFKACGFREDDILGSTTMMYTRYIPECTDGDQMVKRFGRKLLLIPPVRELSSPSRTVESYRGMEDLSSNTLESEC